MADRLLVVAPFSNSPMRDWPAAHYRRLIELCLQDRDRRIVVLGTAAQREGIAALIQCLPSRVENAAGTMDWSGVGRLIRGADAVIANNSGIAHLAAEAGARTVCIFGGSHAVHEWMPRGRRVLVLQAQLPCSPCSPAHDLDCPHQIRCLSALTPDFVFSQLRDFLAAPLAA